MKRSQLGAGRKSLDRGSTFASRGDGLKRTPSPARPRAISPASAEQREAVRWRSCLVCARTPVDPMHVVPRGMGGCSDALCVVPA